MISKNNNYIDPFIECLMMIGMLSSEHNVLIAVVREHASVLKSRTDLFLGMGSKCCS